VSEAVYHGTAEGNVDQIANLVEIHPPSVFDGLRKA